MKQTAEPYELVYTVKQEADFTLRIVAEDCRIVVSTSK